MAKRKDNIDVSRIDLKKLGEQVAKNPGLIPFPHTVGGVAIKPEDKGKIKGRAVTAMRQQTEQQLQQLYEQMHTLATQAAAIKKRVEISERIYGAQMNFEPIIGQIYYIYHKDHHTDVLSIMGPEEWGRSMPFSSYVGGVKLLADHTWEVIQSNEQ